MDTNKVCFCSICSNPICPTRMIFHTPQQVPTLSATQIRESFRTENGLERSDSVHYLDPLIPAFWNKLSPSPNINQMTLQKALLKPRQERLLLHLRLKVTIPKENARAGLQRESQNEFPSLITCSQSLPCILHGSHSLHILKEEERKDIQIKTSSIGILFWGNRKGEINGTLICGYNKTAKVIWNVTIFLYLVILIYARASRWLRHKESAC